MPREHFDSKYKFLSKEKIISYEEIILIIKSALPLGLKKIRITGGEPLIRKDISKLIKMIRELDDHIDIAITTNGALLRKNIKLLKQSGLNRVTVSLDSLDDELFKEITDSDFDVKDVLNGIEAAIEAGFEVKINSVIKRNLNEKQLIPLMEKSIHYNVPIRFIEFMDVGSTNSWNLDSVITGSEMRKIITQNFGPLVQKNSNYYGEVAKQWTILDKEYDFGFIESISSPFCGSCTRARISSNGHLFTCLFSEKGHDILSMIRMGAEVSDVSQAINKIWNNRNDNYSEERKENTDRIIPVEMSYIGG